MVFPHNTIRNGSDIQISLDLIWTFPTKIYQIYLINKIGLILVNSKSKTKVENRLENEFLKINKNISYKKIKF